MHIFGASSLQQPSYRVVVHEVTGERFSIGLHEFDFISLPPAGNHGLRFTWNGKQYAITGDSNFHQDEIDFLNNVDLAIIDSGHIKDGEIVALAVATRAKAIVCSHLYREVHAPRLQAMAAKDGYHRKSMVRRVWTALLPATSAPR